MERPARPRCVISVDLEEWSDARIAGVSLDERGDLSPSLGLAVARLLDLFERTGARATFFVLGRVARRYPDLVQRIAAGHEIASHGDSHTSFVELGPEKAADELRTSVDLLAELSRQEIVGFRAPNWSLGGCPPWPTSLLASHGIRYDSSIVPRAGLAFVRGGKSTPRGPHLICESPRLWEFPPSVVQLPGCSLPAAGGAFMRFLPLSIALRTLARDRDAGLKPHVHIRPWELSPPERAPIGAIRSAMMFAGCSTVARKLETVLEAYQAVPIVDCWHELEGVESRPPADASSHVQAGVGESAREWTTR